MNYLYCTLFSLFSWFSWILIHEFSHLIAVNQFRIVKEWKLYPYPHVADGGWYWARIVYFYYFPKLTEKEEFVVKLAPRIPNTFAAIMFPLLVLLPYPFCIFWMIFWGAGLIDLFVGSIGRREHSDLVLAAKIMNINPWLIRIFGFSLILLSLLVTFIVL